MKHLGDICKISGRDAPTVNVIIGGSPCQDLSVAGKRAGLSGERSGLFMEQIRIIKEMREKDAESGRTGADIRPRFMVWENVPGAFSVNGGRDFAAVLEETIRVVEQEAPDILPPAKGWTYAGCIMGDGWSVAWRVLDAQFWGVPQRRRRIALVADFGGECAPEILFERKSMSGHSEPCESARERTAGDAADRAGESSVYCLQGNGIDRADTAGCNGRGWTDGSCYTLNTIDRPAVCFCKTTKPHSIEEAPTITQSDISPALNTFDVGESRSNVYACIPEVCRTLSARYDSSPCVDRGQEFVCYESHDQDARYRPLGEVSETVSAKYGTGGGDQPIVIFAQKAFGSYMQSKTASTCKQRDYKDATDLVCAVDCRNGTENPDVNGTLQCKENGGTSVNLNNVVRQKYIVRRLTPLECERLQGYPDGWTDIEEWTDTKGKNRKLSDATRYKALGNSIAIPPWLWVLSRLNEYCEEKTMASLFDGIGGFPLIWEFLNGTGSAVWCSEIEEFPIAVTKRRFPDKQITIIFANEDVDCKEYNSAEAASKELGVSVTELIKIINGKAKQRKEFFAAWTDELENIGGNMTQFEIIMRTDTPELPAEIGNFEEVKAAISEALEQYSTDAVVTEETVKDAEKTRAHLRKVKDQIETYRKDAKAAYLEKFNKLEAQCKELSGLIDKPITAIDGKIKEFENAENDKKYNELQAFFDQIGAPEWLKLDDVISPKWKNKTATIDKLRQEISESVCKIEDDLSELEKLYAASPLWTAILEKFRETKDKSKTLVYAAQLERQHSEEQKRAEAIQKARAAEEAARAEIAQNAICEPEAPQAVTQPETVQTAATAQETQAERLVSGSFRVAGTREQIKALAQFMKNTGIRYEVIK